MGLRLIFIILIIYFLIRFFVRYALPYLAMYFLKKKVDQAKASQNKKQEFKNNKKEELGDYVDFEEIKDDEK